MVIPPILSRETDNRVSLNHLGMYNPPRNEAREQRSNPDHRCIPLELGVNRLAMRRELSILVLVFFNGARSETAKLAQ